MITYRYENLVIIIPKYLELKIFLIIIEKIFGTNPGGSEFGQTKNPQKKYIHECLWTWLDSAIKSLLDVLAQSPLCTNCPRETYIWSLCGPDVAKINSIQIKPTNLIFE